ncbi:hypothetical protein K439DRAFT_685450 [Ramaria rubella]|nr:hypothetical protein K439DRAFT_685450 [Ramaria rubella]
MASDFKGKRRRSPTPEDSPASRVTRKIKQQASGSSIQDQPFAIPSSSHSVEMSHQGSADPTAGSKLDHHRPPHHTELHLGEANMFAIIIHHPSVNLCCQDPFIRRYYTMDPWLGALDLMWLNNLHFPLKFSRRPKSQQIIPMWLHDPSLSRYPCLELLFQIKLGLLPCYLNTILLTSLLPQMTYSTLRSSLTPKDIWSSFSILPSAMVIASPIMNRIPFTAQDPHTHSKILLLKIHILESTQKIPLWTPISPWGVQAQLTGDTYLNINRKGNWKVQIPIFRCKLFRTHKLHMCKTFSNDHGQQVPQSQQEPRLEIPIAHSHNYTATEHLGVQPLASTFHVSTFSDHGQQVPQSQQEPYSQAPMAHPGNHIPTAHLGVQPLASTFHVSTSQPISYPPTLPPLPPSPPSTPNRLDELVQRQQQLEWHMGTLASTCQAMQSTQKEILSYLQVLGNANTGNIQISEDIQSTCSQPAHTTPQEPWEVVPRPRQKNDEERYLAVHACIQDFMTYFSIQLKSSASNEEVHNYVVEDSLGPTTEGLFCFAYQHERHHQWNLVAGKFLAYRFMVALTKQWYCHEDLPELTLTGLQDQFIKQFYDFQDAWKEAVMSPELQEKHKQEC